MFLSKSRRQSKPSPPEPSKHHQAKAQRLPVPSPTAKSSPSGGTNSKKKRISRSKDDALCLLSLLWFSTAVGAILVTLSLASSWVLITFPVEDRYDGAFLDLSNPRVVALINAAWGLLFTIMLLFVQQLLLSTIIKRVSKMSRMSHATAAHFQFLLRLRITFGAITMVVLLMGVMCVFIERATIRGALVLSGAWSVLCWYWATAKVTATSAIPYEDQLSLPISAMDDVAVETDDHNHSRSYDENDKNVVVV